MHHIASKEEKKKRTYASYKFMIIYRNNIIFRIVSNEIYIYIYIYVKIFFYI